MGRFISFILLIINSLSLQSQIYKTEALSGDFATIQVTRNGDWANLPVVELNSSDFIHINFDRLGDNAADLLRYRIVKCDADWTRSILSDIEYLDGFNDVLSIEDYAYSVNTSVNYVNYRFSVPNNRLRIKQSGNYMAEVYESNNPMEILMRACFSIVDPQILMRGEISANTDIDSNKEHQQVSFSIDYNNLNVRDVFSDLKIFVRQNNRLDNERSGLKPSSIQRTKLIYEHNRNLIFEAGNEYRRFETVSYRYNGLNVEQTVFQNPYYYTRIIPDKIRAGMVYVYDQDQDGLFFIRNAEGTNSNIDADYFITNFRLEAPEPFLEPVYLNGAFTDNLFSDTYRMIYDYDKREYYATLLLKQGAYNYQYLTQSGNSYSPALIEGNHYETENQYSIFVYYRPLGQRSDLLVGVLQIKNK